MPQRPASRRNNVRSVDARLTRFRPSPRTARTVMAMATSLLVQRWAGRCGAGTRSPNACPDGNEVEWADTSAAAGRRSGVFGLTTNRVMIALSVNRLTARSNAIRILRFMVRPSRPARDYQRPPARRKAQDQGYLPAHPHGFFIPDGVRCVPSNDQSKLQPTETLVPRPHDGTAKFAIKRAKRREALPGRSCSNSYPQRCGTDKRATPLLA